MAEQPIAIDEISDPNQIRVQLFQSGKSIHAPLTALDQFYDWATVTHAATAKTTLADLDELSIVDSAASNVIKKITWANVKATAKTYFDTLYQPLQATLTSWAAITRAAGFDTFTATPTSANLRALVTDETGSGGALVFATSPTIAAPNINTINLTGGQIAFPAVDVPSANANTLDDYEEGTWTPVITAGSGTFTTVSATGSYTKIGRMVTVLINVTMTTVGTASGSVIATLPFTANASGNWTLAGRAFGTGKMLQAQISGSGTSAAILTYDNVTAIAAASLAVSGTYWV